jgi:hypothetical protein
MFADAPRQPRDIFFVMVGGLDRDMAVAVGQGDEIAFGIDHDLLQLARAFLQQPAKQVRFSTPRIALDEQSCGEQFLQIHEDRLAGWDRCRCRR